MTQKCLDYVGIVASGEGSRLLPITYNIPKLLVPYKNIPLLSHIINYWKDYTNNFVIVINSKYNNLIIFYLNFLDIQYEIINIDITNKYENSYTIHNAFKNNKFYNKKILLTWCDIFPESKIPYNVFSNNNIIFTYKNYGRYNADADEITKQSLGNIIGIYYFHNFKNIEVFDNTMDICDCYSTNFGKYVTYEIDNLIDIGDMDKLLNQIKINNFNNYNIQKYNVTVYQYLKNISLKEKLEYIKQLLLFITDFHKKQTTVITYPKIYKDIHNEFYDKTLNNINNIKSLLMEYNYIITVNDVIITKSIDFIINDLYNKINKNYNNSTKYNSIHKNISLSNIFTSNTKFYLINNCEYFGIPECDFSKILFSLSGYDEIENDDNFIFIINNKNIEINIKNNIDSFIHLFNNKKILIYMIIVYWFHNAYSNKMNIHKCISSYYYGIYLYHIYFV